jgi:hypothetical protein
LLGRGKAPSRVVTKFSLKKDTNQGGITYSKVVFTAERDLTPNELKSLQPIINQVKNIRETVTPADASEE